MIDKEADYYLVYYWALWYKSFSKKNIKSVREILARADTTKNGGIIPKMYHSKN